MDTDAYLRFGLAFILVIGLILLAGALFRRFAGGVPMMGGGRKGPRRLQVVESLSIDPRRRLLLVRRDGVEHLLLVGGSGDKVVESGIPVATPSAGTIVTTNAPSTHGGGAS